MKETTKIGLPEEAVEFISSNLIQSNSFKVYDTAHSIGYLGDSVELYEWYLTNHRIVREVIEKIVFHDGYKVYTCLVGDEGETLYSWEEKCQED